VEKVDQSADGFSIRTIKDEYQAKFIVVATGFYGEPRLMHVPGENLPKVKHYYDEPHPYVKQKVAVIGAANSACDVALELYHKEAQVTMIVRGPTINDRVKYWIKPNIENRIKEGSITAFFNSKVKEIRPHDLIIDTPEGEVTLENDFVLAMTGYQPDFPFLASMGITFEKNELKVIEYDPESHETKVPGIYVAGVVCGGLKTNKFFIENAKDHSERIIQNIMSKKNILQT
jgi:thioredoxin reductase (NADPH)